MNKFLMSVPTLVLALVLCLTPAVVKAVPILDFNMDPIHPAGVSISYAGGASPLVGANISVDEVIGLGTPSNNWLILPLTGAILSFTTGPFVGSDSSQWKFAGGGSITILLGQTPLLVGSWNNASVFAVGGEFKITGGSFTDRKFEELLEIYGLPTGVPYSGNINLSFEATGLPGNPFSSWVVLSGDVVNSPIPEPATMLLLGSGLIGLAGYGRKKFFKK